MGIVAAGGMLAASTGAVSADTFGNGKGQGIGYQEMLTQKAQVLKMNVEELKNKLQSGMRFFEIAEEKGVSKDELKTKMQNAQKSRLEKLVNQGTITKEQMQERLEWQKNRQANCGNNEPAGPRGGMGIGRGGK